MNFLGAKAKKRSKSNAANLGNAANLENFHIPTINDDETDHGEIQFAQTGSASSSDMSEPSFLKDTIQAMNQLFDEHSWGTTENDNQDILQPTIRAQEKDIENLDEHEDNNTDSDSEFILTIPKRIDGTSIGGNKGSRKKQRQMNSKKRGQVTKNDAEQPTNPRELRRRRLQQNESLSQKWQLPPALNRQNSGHCSPQPPLKEAVFDIPSNISSTSMDIDLDDLYDDAREDFVTESQWLKQSQYMLQQELNQAQIRSQQQQHEISTIKGILRRSKYSPRVGSHENPIVLRSSDRPKNEVDLRRPSIRTSAQSISLESEDDTLQSSPGRNASFSDSSSDASPVYSEDESDISSLQTESSSVSGQTIYTREQSASHWVPKLWGAGPVAACTMTDSAAPSKASLPARGAKSTRNESGRSIVSVPSSDSSSSSVSSDSSRARRNSGRRVLFMEPSTTSDDSSRSVIRSEAGWMQFSDDGTSANSFPNHDHFDNNGMETASSSSTINMYDPSTLGGGSSAPTRNHSESDRQIVTDDDLTEAIEVRLETGTSPTKKKRFNKIRRFSLGKKEKSATLIEDKSALIYSCQFGNESDRGSVSNNNNSVSVSDDLENQSVQSLVMIGNIDFLGRSRTPEPPVRTSREVQQSNEGQSRTRKTSYLRQCIWFLAFLVGVGVVAVLLMWFTADLESAAILEPPANDLCSGAVGPLPINGGAQTFGTTKAASIDTFNPVGQDLIINSCTAVSSGNSSEDSGPGVWYLVQGNGKKIVASACRTNVAVDIVVFQGGCEGLLCVKSSSDLVTYSSYRECEASVVWETIELEPYYILVRGISADDEGGFALTVEPIIQNGLCQDSSGPLPLDARQKDRKYRLLGTTIGAPHTEEARKDLPVCAQDDDLPAHGAWYSIIGTGHSWSLSTCDNQTDFQATISVFHGTMENCKELSCIPTQIAHCEGFEFGSSTHLRTEKDATYYIFIHGSTESDEGNFVLNVEQSSLSNDLCVNALGPLPTDKFAIGGSTINSTLDLNAPWDSDSCAGFQAQTSVDTRTFPGVWYWIEGSGKSFKATLCNAESGQQSSGNSEAHLAVYHGSTCDALSCFPVEESRSDCAVIVWTSIPSERYYVHVQSPVGLEGNYQLSFEEFELGRSCPTPIRLFDESSSSAGEGNERGSKKKKSANIESSTNAAAYYDGGPFCQFEHPKSPVSWHYVLGTGYNITASTCDTENAVESDSRRARALQRTSSPSFRPVISLLAGSCQELECVSGISHICADQNITLQLNDTEAVAAISSGQGETSSFLQPATQSINWESRVGIPYYILVHGELPDTQGYYKLQVNRHDANESDNGSGAGENDGDPSDDFPEPAQYKVSRKPIPKELWITICGFGALLFVVVGWKWHSMYKKNRL